MALGNYICVNPAGPFPFSHLLSFPQKSSGSSPITGSSPVSGSALDGPSALLVITGFFFFPIEGKEKKHASTSYSFEGLERMTQWLREHVALAEDPHLVASIHIAGLMTVTPDPRALMPFSGLFRHLYSLRHTHTHTIIEN